MVRYKMEKRIIDQKIRGMKKYKLWREKVFAEGYGVCEKCGLGGERCQAHHKIKLGVIILENNIKCVEEALNCEAVWDINNGMVLCSDCHMEEHYG